MKAGGKGSARPPRGFTIMEVVIAFTILGVVMLLVAQVATYSLRERWRTTARQAALEIASNILEVARACPWEKLDANWAAAQRLPDNVDPHLADARLEVRVDPEKTLAQIKRVRVILRWQAEESWPEQVVTLEALFGPRLMEIRP